MYKSLLRPLLFKSDPEKVHYFTFKMVRNLHRLGFAGIFRSIYKITDKRLPQNHRMETRKNDSSG